MSRARPNNMQRGSWGLKVTALAERRGFGRGFVNPLVKPEPSAKYTFEDAGLEV